MDHLAYISDNIAIVKAQMARAAERAGRSADEVTLVAVTKTYPVEHINAAANAGLTCMGENRIQEALPKIAACSPDLHWHLIGHLQSNKARLAVGNFDLVHSVDSVKLARELGRHAAAKSLVQDILLQVNISGEMTKSGFEPDEVEQAIGTITAECPAVRIGGFMTMAPFTEPEEARPTFTGLRNLRDKLTGSIHHERFSPHHLSMGMSNDYEIAIEEGATLVRIGSSLFRKTTW